MQDYISFRHHTYEQPAGVKSIELKVWHFVPCRVAQVTAAVKLKSVVSSSSPKPSFHFLIPLLQERGPRFECKLYQIKLGTVDQAHAENEWVLRA